MPKVPLWQITLAQWVTVRQAAILMEMTPRCVRNLLDTGALDYRRRSPRGTRISVASIRRHCAATDHTLP